MSRPSAHPLRCQISVRPCAARWSVFALGWILSACSSGTEANNSNSSGMAGATVVVRTGAAPSGTGGTPATLAPGANTGASAGGVPMPKPNSLPGTGQAGVAAPSAGPPMPPPGSSGVAGSAVSAAGAGSVPTQSSGCGLEPTPSGSGIIQVDGMDRTYQFSVPQSYDKNRHYPILFAFHGAGVPASAFRTYFNMTQVVGPDAIVVYPEALGSPMAWNPQRDLPLFDALLTQFKAQYCVDDKHVFAAGHSSGGYFTHAVGCQRGNVVRGI